MNNTLHTDYNANADRLASDMKSSPKGTKADGDVEINGGEIKVVTTGNGAEGIVCARHTGSSGPGGRP